MIPIECPKCGRGGNVPPDRLNARLVCKACHSVFHMDNSGKLILGEPGVPDRKANRHAEAAKASADFEFSDALKKIPAPIKFGVPIAALAAALWMQFGPGPGAPDYLQSSERIVKAVAANDKSRVLSFASDGSADATGKWFELVHDAFSKQNVAADSYIVSSLWGGNPEKGTDIQVAVIVSDPATSKQFSIPINLAMTKAGGSWAFDGTRTFADAEKLFASTKSPSR